jgi:hypothetical protein
VYQYFSISVFQYISISVRGLAYTRADGRVLAPRVPLGAPGRALREPAPPAPNHPERDARGPNNLDADSDGMACDTYDYGDGGGSEPASDQYSPNTPVNNPNAFVPNTNAKTMPNTGGPPYLAVGAMLLLGMAVVMGRGVLRR